MGRGNKHYDAPKKISERDMIVQYRNGLKGARAEKFDEIFYSLIGVSNDGGIRKALNKSANPHKAYVAAKAAVDALNTQSENIQFEDNVDVSSQDEYGLGSLAAAQSKEWDMDDPNIDWNDPELWRQQSK